MHLGSLNQSKPPSHSAAACPPEHEDGPATAPTGIAPVAIVMISLNEAHNLKAVCQNLAGWAQEIFLLDSFSQDATVDVALQNGIRVYQRRFTSFGEQWNAALAKLPISAQWTMKLDPDERLSNELKQNLRAAMLGGKADGLRITRRLWFMGRPLPVRQSLIRAWRTGSCQFTDVAVNEYPIVTGVIADVCGDLEHHDSPDLDHWLEKQNRYTTAEALIAYGDGPTADEPRLFGTSLQRRMWMKKNYRYLPFRYLLFFIHHWLWLGAWRAGWVGYAWARLRSDVMRLVQYKRREIELTGRLPVKRFYGPGEPDNRVPQIE